MDIDPTKEWEKKLRDLGMPAEMPLEHEKAADEGVELISTDIMDKESRALEKRLREEDPRNLFGGFPTSTEKLVSTVKDLRNDWITGGVDTKDITLTIHASCINGNDCLTLSQAGGNKYHYNTGRIRGYSRESVIRMLKGHGLSFKEK